MSLLHNLFFTLLILSVGGVLLARYLNPDYPPLQAILAGVGLIFGLILDIIFILQFLRFQKRNEDVKYEEIDYED